MAAKITPVVWDAVRQVVEKHPGVLSEAGSAIETLPGAAGRNLHVALRRADIFVVVPKAQVPGAPRGMVRYEAGPTKWRLTPEAQVELDKFLEGGAKVGGKRPQLTDTNVFALQELIARNQSTEEGGDFFGAGIPARRIENSPHVRRLFEFGALERVASPPWADGMPGGYTYVRVTPVGRELARARFMVFEPPPRGQERSDLERRARLPLGGITRTIEALGLDEAELDRIRESRHVGPDARRGVVPANARLILYKQLLAGTSKPLAGHSAGTALLVIGAVVGGLLLLRPLFRDAFEQHKWNMENDPVYRRSQQAMEISSAARNIADTLRVERGSPGFWGSAGGRALDRADVVRILADHFRTHPRYKHWSANARSWFYALSVELVDEGADPQSALALTHGLAHNLSALEEFGWHLKTAESIKIDPLRVPVRVVAQALLSGKLKVARRPVLSMATERRMRRAGSKS